MDTLAPDGFAAYLRGKRTQAGLSVPELARRAGVSVAYISRVEQGWRGTPSARVLQRLALALQIPIAEILEAAGILPLGSDLSKKGVAAGILFRSAEGLTDAQIQDIVEYIELRKRQWTREQKATARDTSPRSAGEEEHNNDVQ